MEPEQILLIYCVLRQIERSIDNRLPVSSNDWPDVAGFFQGKRRDTLNHATDQAREFLAGEPRTNSSVAASQSLHQRFYHRAAFVMHMKRAVERVRLSGNLKADEKILLFSVFQRFQELLERPDLQNADAVRLRDDAVLCETMIETRFPGLKGLHEAKNVEAVGISNRHRIYTVEEVVSILNGKNLERASYKTA